MRENEVVGTIKGSLKSDSDSNATKFERQAKFKAF